MPNTIEAYINGKPLNPNRDLPHRTLAQAQTEGLTSSNRLWVRTDGDNTPINARQIEPVLITEIPANTYSNYETALKKLNETFSTLSTNDKMKCVIVRGDNVTYSFSAFSGGFGALYPSSSTVNMCESLYLADGMYLSTTWSGSTTTTTSKSSNLQDQNLKMYIV